MNYSILNNYQYENKSTFRSTLDWLSTPARKVFGGRTVYVLSQTQENKMSSANKVTTVFFSFLVFPVAIISMISLLTKSVTSSFWEKKQVKEQTDQTWEIINQFLKAFEKNQYDEAINTLNKRPEIRKREDVDKKLFTLINLAINNGKPWEIVSKSLPLLSTQDAIALIHHAIKTKLEKECKNNYHFLTSGKQIIDFIQNSLKQSGIIGIESCYKKLLSDVLQVDVNQNILYNSLQMDLADQIIQSFVSLKKSSAKNALDCVSADLEANVLRSNIFKKGQNYSSYWTLLHSPESMQKIHFALENLLDVNQIGWQAVKNLGNLSEKDSQRRWEQMQNESIKFQQNLTHWENNTQDQEKKEFIQAIQKRFTTIIDSTNSILQTSKEIKPLISQLNKDLEQQTENLKKLIHPKNPSTNLDAILSTLELKELSDLLLITEKMTSFLMDNVNKILLMEMQKQAQVI